MSRRIKASVRIKNYREYFELIEQLKEIVEKLKKFNFKFEITEHFHED